MNELNVRPFLGSIVDPQEINSKSNSFRDIPGRTKGLIHSLDFWSLFVLSFFGVVIIIYPVMSGAIEYGLIIRPKFDSMELSDNILRVVSIISQWNLPAQLIHLLFGSAGSLFAGFIGLVFGCREIGLLTNPERYHRIHNNYAFLVCLITQCSHSIALSGYWTIYRFSPPSTNRTFLFLSRVFPHLVAIILSLNLGILHLDIVEIFLPLSVFCSVLGIVLSVIFAFFIHDVSLVLPADAYYCKAFFRPDPVAVSLRRIFSSRFVWCNVLLLSWLFGFQHFWIANIPAIQFALQAPISIHHSYSIFLTCDFFGRYIFPFFLDIFVGSKFSRMDLLLLLLFPYLLCNIIISFVSSKFTIFFISFLSVPNALLTVYLISCMRATVDNFFFPSLLNIAQTFSIIVALILDSIFAYSNIGFYCHFILSFSVSFLLFCLWLLCRDYEVDRFGFCSAGIFGSRDRHFVSLSYIPTAMIPLWVIALREYDKIQQHYHEWNIMRTPPSQLKELTKD